jgi:gliding motility-associated-like protein
MRNIYFICAMLTLLVSTVVNAQQANIWYLVDSNGIDFGNGNAVLLNYKFHQTSTSTPSSTASISDKNGHLLFYSDGSNIWDQNNHIMPNGSGINGAGGWQTLVIQQPASPLYYLIYSSRIQITDTSVQILYSVVDMSLNNGLGAVTSNKNVLLFDKVSAKIGTATHANGRDTWLIFHSMTGNTFYSFLISTTGISSTPVSCNIGNYQTAINFLGQIKPSPDGSKIAMSTPNLLPQQYVEPSDNPSSIEIFNFDNSTAQMSDPIFINIPCHYLESEAADGAAFGIVGLEFSPNGKLLYGCQSLTDTQFVFQMDICNYNQASVTASLQKVGFADQGWNFFQMQLAPDGKIYIARGDSILSVIKNPNVKGIGCGFQGDGFNLGSDAQLGSSPITLPYFTNSVVKSINQSRISALGYCAAVGTSFALDEVVDSVKWNFGDTATGIVNESTSLDPGHFYGRAGTFVVTAILYTNCSIDTVIKTITIYGTSPTFLGNDTTLCFDQGITLFATIPGQTVSYLWQDGTTDPFLPVTRAGKYWVTVHSDGCVISDSIRVSYLSSNKIFNVHDTSICIGNTILLDAGNPGASYVWQDNNEAQTELVTRSGQYWVMVKTNGCTSSDTILCNFVVGPKIDLGNDTSICKGQQLVLFAGAGPASYLWSDSSKMDSLRIVQSGKYWVNVSGNGCTNRDTILISSIPTPAIFLGNDTTLCNGTSLILNTLQSTPSQFLWQDGTTLGSYVVNQPGTYNVRVTNEFDCSITDTINVKYRPPPIFSIGADTVLCTGQSLKLSPVIVGSSNSYTYQWNNGSTDPSKVTVNAPGLYWLRVSDNGCAVIDSILVSYKANPFLELGNDTTLCIGQTLTLTVPLNNATFVWQDGSTQPFFTVTNAGIYSVTVTQNGCDTASNIQVEYMTKPPVSFGPDTTLCITETLLLDASYLNSNYKWQDGSTSPQFKVMLPGAYIVDVSNTCGETRDSIMVAYDNCACKFYIPSGFTPNNDGKNDIFKPKYQCIFGDYVLRVFNRNGQLIFFSKNIAEGWDGTFRNLPQSSGTYVWELSYRDSILGREVHKNGTILLVR